MLTQNKHEANPTPEQLRHGSYRLITELDHEQILFFVKAYIKKKNLFVMACWLANILVVLWIVVQLFVPSLLSVAEKLSYFSVGLVLFLLILLPVHELIHAAVYKWQGAKHIIIEAQWRKLIFLALADKFVVNSRQFYLVALAPFVLITAALLLLASQSGATLQWISYGALLFHTSGCVGDFSLCSYLYENRHLEIYTYDDHQEKKSYFYSKTLNKAV